MAVRPGIPASAPGIRAGSARRQPDLVILDVGPGSLDSAEVIRTLRQWSHAPIIVLSGCAGSAIPPRTSQAISGSHLPTPWRRGELAAIGRQASMITNGGGDPPLVRIGDVVVDRVAKRVIRQCPMGGAEQDVRLTPTEWHLLDVLLRYPGRLLSRQQLLAEVWGPGYARAAGNLRLYMTQLRRKLEPDPARPRWLVTERGMGYRFQPDPSDDSRIGPP